MLQLADIISQDAPGSMYRILRLWRFQMRIICVLATGAHLLRLNGCFIAFWFHIMDNVIDLLLNSLGFVPHSISTTAIVVGLFAHAPDTTPETSS